MQRAAHRATDGANRRLGPPGALLLAAAAARRDDAGPAEYSHVALAPYPGAEDGDVLPVDGGAVAAWALP